MEPLVSRAGFVNGESDGYGCSDTALEIGFGGRIFIPRIYGLRREPIMQIFMVMAWALLIMEGGMGRFTTIGIERNTEYNIIVCPQCK